MNDDSSTATPDGAPPNGDTTLPKDTAPTKITASADDAASAKDTASTKDTEATQETASTAGSRSTRSPKHTAPAKDTVSLSKGASTDSTADTADDGSGSAPGDAVSGDAAGATSDDTSGGRRSSGRRRAGTFIYPLPSTPLPSSTPMTSTTTTVGTTKTVGDHAFDRTLADTVGVGATNEGTFSMTSTSTNGTPATGVTQNGAVDGLGAGAPSRRNSMGVASVRIAARLAQGELTSRASRTHADPTLDSDELLQLLGEYLLAGGLEKPEIHATLGGQPIVVDLQTPGRFTR
ncbi:MAG: hypothetical protein GXY65_04740 [Rhodococcus sp.]|nr:hypothetical protein [Rhodococcus sp. (in: high G+C Gram-positive bacteria)]